MFSGGLEDGKVPGSQESDLRRMEVCQEVRKAGQGGAICMRNQSKRHKTDWKKANRGLLCLRDRCKKES